MDSLDNVRLWVYLGPALILISIPLLSYLYSKFWFFKDLELQRWVHRFFGLFYTIAPIIVIIIPFFNITSGEIIDGTFTTASATKTSYAIYEFRQIPDYLNLNLPHLFLFLLVLYLIYMAFGVAYLLKRISHARFYASVGGQVLTLLMIGLLGSTIGANQGNFVVDNFLRFHYFDLSSLNWVMQLILAFNWIYNFPFVIEWYRRKNHRIYGEEKYLMSEYDEE